MSTRDDLILWLDLETTGNGPDADILEVGVSLRAGKSGTIIVAERDWVVAPREWSRFLSMDPVVVDMHTKNGLAFSVMADTSVKQITDMDDVLCGFLRFNGVGKGEMVPLAGSGVSHFDRPYIRRDFPKFDKFLTYWAYDVGVIRRTLRLSGYDIPDAEPAHRALADAQAHAEEFRRYRDMLEGKLQVCCPRPVDHD